MRVKLYIFFLVSFSIQKNFAQKSELGKVVFHSDLNCDVRLPNGYRWVTEGEKAQRYGLGPSPYRIVTEAMKGKQFYIGLGMLTLLHLKPGERNESFAKELEKANNSLFKFNWFQHDTLSKGYTIDKKKIKAINIDTALIRPGIDTITLEGKKYCFMYVTLIKYDLGAVWLHYTYKIGEQKKAIKEIHRTWGLVKFRPDSTIKNVFEEGSKYESIYLGKYAYLNRPALLKKDSLLLKRKQLVNRYQNMINKAIELYNNKQHLEARRNLKKAIAFFPERIEAYSQLFFIDMAKKSLDSALIWLNKIKTISPKSTNTLFLEGGYHIEKQDFPSAKEVLEKISRLDIFDFRGFVLLGQQHLKNKEYDKALNVYTEAIDIYEKLKIDKNKELMLSYRVKNNIIADFYHKQYLLFGSNTNIVSARQALLKAQELGYKLSSEDLKFLEEN